MQQPWGAGEVHVRAERFANMPSTEPRRRDAMSLRSEPVQLRLDVPRHDPVAVPLQGDMLALQGRAERSRPEDADAFATRIAHAVVDQAPAAGLAQRGAERL